ncbi:hypothetical protein FRC07_001504 [Ceratobasidium sp. 392]|nr:hypothetical protein FRC07_001504 [Ceratobasidium sp. 392]
MWKLFRLATCFVLITLSIAAISLAEPCQKIIPDGNATQFESDLVSEMKYGFGRGRGRGHKHKKQRSTELCLSEQQAEQLSLSVFYIYVTVLALLAVALESVFRALCNSHLVLLLLFALTVDSWAVVLPAVAFWIPTPSHTPLDWISWARTIILAFTAIVIPIYIQRSYIQHEQIPKASARTIPASGRLVAKDLTARYSPDGPVALNKVSLSIDAGQRICVIGKAGTPEALHSHITFISEQPGISFGSVRETLNLQNLFNDIALDSTLRSVGLEVRLDAIVDDLSEEERVRILLAKAIICRSKVVILEDGDDELTQTVRLALQTRLTQSTLIILTSELYCVRDIDQVFVLDAGRIVEYGPPGDLLQKWSGPFKAMVDASEIRITATESKKAPIAERKKVKKAPN